MTDVKPEKLYRRVLDAVMDDIAAGRTPVGNRLPAERDMAEVHGVSRTTVREALVALEMLGIVELRKGSGVYVVSTVGTSAVADLSIGAFELIEARRLIEGEIAALAAVYATDAHIEQLARTIDMMRDGDELVTEKADRDFHILLAQATGNGALVATVTDLWDMRERAPLARNILHRARKLGTGSRIDEHAAVLAAIRAHDADGARRAMRDHLHRVIVHLLTTTENDDVEAARQRTDALRQRTDSNR